MCLCAGVCFSLGISLTTLKCTREGPQGCKGVCVCACDRMMYQLCLTGHTHTHFCSHLSSPQPDLRVGLREGLEGCTLCHQVALLCHPTPPTPYRQASYSLETPPHHHRCVSINCTCHSPRLLCRQTGLNSFVVFVGSGLNRFLC